MTAKLSELSLIQLQKQKEEYERSLRFINNEITKRQNEDSAEIKLKIPLVNKTMSTKSSTTISKKIDETKKKTSGSKACTKEDIKVILKKKDISFKANASKDDLMTLVRKHNLVRTVEEYHKNK